jgi:hypothetical protein
MWDLNGTHMVPVTTRGQNGHFVRLEWTVKKPAHLLAFWGLFYCVRIF